MPRYRLEGGPCDGTLSRNFTVTPIVGFSIFCQGNEYEFQRRGDIGPSPHPNDGVFVIVTGPFGAELGPTALGSSAPHGYHAIQRAVNRRLPGALRISAYCRHAARRHLRQRRR